MSSCFGVSYERRQHIATTFGSSLTLGERSYIVIAGLVESAGNGGCSWLSTYRFEWGATSGGRSRQKEKMRGMTMTKGSGSLRGARRFERSKSESSGEKTLPVVAPALLAYSLVCRWKGRTTVLVNQEVSLQKKFF